MYISNQTCPDCGHVLHVTWHWPAVVMGRQLELTFVCQNCAVMQALEGYAVKQPFKNAVTITPTGRNVLQRHFDAYQQARPYLADQSRDASGYFDEKGVPARC